MSDSTQQRFAGLARLHGQQGLQKLHDAHVCVVGVGGVGSWVAETLARSGVGSITLIDADDVCVSNINRQIHALTQTIGQAKVAAMAVRINSINPECRVQQQCAFFLPTNAEKLIQGHFDFVVDAIDSIHHKCLLLALCQQKHINIISVGGAGGKKDIKNIQIADLSLTHGDRLLSKVRASLRKNYAFPKYTGKKFNINCVFSPEPVKLPWCDMPQGQQRSSLKLDCNNGFGTDMAVISIFGITAAHHVIQQILAKPTA